MADIRITVPVSNYALEPIVPKATWTTLTNRQYQVRRGGEGMALVLQRVNAGGEINNDSAWGTLAAQFAALEIPGNIAVVNFAEVCGYQRKGFGEYQTMSALKPGDTRVQVPNIFSADAAGSIRTGDIIEIAGRNQARHSRAWIGDSSDRIQAMMSFLQFMPRGCARPRPSGNAH